MDPISSDIIGSLDHWVEFEFILQLFSSIQIVHPKQGWTEKRTLIETFFFVFCFHEPGDQMSQSEKSLRPDALHCIVNGMVKPRVE